MAGMTTDGPTLPVTGTVSLLVAVATVFLIQMLHAGDVTGPDIEHLEAAANIGYLSLTTDPWRLFTSIFMHGGWVHLLMNAAFLMSIGPRVEALFGLWRYLMIFVAGGLLAAVGSAVWSLSSMGKPNLFGQMVYQVSVSVGASGALMALCAALLVGAMLDGDEVEPRLAGYNAFNSVMPAVGLTLLQGAMLSGVDQAAHVFGLMAGAVIGPLAYIPRHAASALRVGSAWVVTPLATAAIVAMLVPLPSAHEAREQMAGLERMQQQEQEHEPQQEAMRHFSPGYGRSDEAINLNELMRVPQAADMLSDR